MTQFPRSSKFSKSVILFLVLFLFCFTANNSAQSIGFAKDSTVICFLSDTQEPMLFERLFLGYNNNSVARRLILSGIVNMNPDAVFHLGDLVASGSDDDDWAEIDRFKDKLEKRGIDFYAIPGNHEYMFSAERGIMNFRNRFPESILTGYIKKINNLAIVLLNSNFSKMSEKEINYELNWYRKTIKEIDEDPGINFIIVCSHHSPYTNSKIINPSSELQKYYIPSFSGSKKAILFLSGHAHALEHFNENGKDFLVIGGGGGIQQPLKTGTNVCFKDLYDTKSTKRMFHFLKLILKEQSVALELLIVSDKFDRLIEKRYLTLPDSEK